MAGPPTGSEVIQTLLERLRDELDGCRQGAVAEYIPELARAAADDFGIVLATVDGRIYAVGDADKAFTIQSISKPFMYGLALKLLSADAMQAKVGLEPSGDAFNAISLDPQSGIPRNPMINAGAIATAAQVWKHDPQQAEAITLAFFSDLAGHQLVLDQAVYRSERETGHRNRAISHLLRNVSVIETEPEAGLDLYFRQCSISVTCRDLAVMAATLACQGRNPLTQQQPLDPVTTTRILAVMGSCGMYDYSGQWLHDVGMPAKSGVGGGVLAVLPGRLGIAVYSPRLDQAGNSVRGIATCRRLSQELGLHLYDRNPLGQTAVRSSYRGTQRQSRRWRSETEENELAPLRSRIAIVHAQGLLDVAAMEQVLATIQAQANDKGPGHDTGTDVIVLDLGQVIELPAASAALLHSQTERLSSAGVSLWLCRCAHLQAGATRRDPIPSFTSLDLALEAAEERLLSQYGPDGEACPEQTPCSAASLPGLLDQLEPDHRWAIAALLKQQHYEAGDLAMARQQASDQLFIVASGRFSVFLPIGDEEGGSRRQLARIATFSAGMVFGDAAFLSGQRRLADVVAETEGSCWLLHRQDFERLRQDDPAATIALLTLLASDLGQKLALCGRQLTLVEHL